MGGISANKYVYQCSDGSAGWWRDVVDYIPCQTSCSDASTPAIDLNIFQVLSIEYLGGNGASSSIPNPLNYDKNNTILPQDQARAIKELMAHLSISNFHAVIGCSYGGFVAMSFAALFPGLVNQLVVICSAHQTPNKAKANRSLQRQIIKLTLNNQQTPREGLKLARSLAMLSYRADDEFDERFSSLPNQTEPHITFEFDDYLDATGNRFIEKFCPYAYLTLSQSIDLFQISPEQIRVPLTTIAFDTDVLIPERLVRQLSEESSGESNHYVISTKYGHDGFLKEFDAINSIIQRHVSATNATYSETNGDFQ